MSAKAVIACMDELLKPLGFARRNATWNRQFDSFIDVIDIQISKAGETVTVNAGVLHPEVHKKCWATEPPAVIDEPLCTVRIRIGQLLDAKDMWWELNDAKIFDDIIERVNAHVLPFLEQMHSLEAMERFLTIAQVTRQKYPLPAICLAIIKSEQGDRTGACALLTELGERLGAAWRNRIREIAGRLGCS